MAGRPKLDKIVERMERGKDFTITRPEYIAITGIDLPQDKSYTEKRSAVAKRAKECGYAIEVIPEKLVFRKVEL